MSEFVHASANASKDSDDGSGSDGTDTGGEGDVVGQNGSRKRKRPMNVTCEACKQRKVRCDRARPKCGWCERNEHHCEYKERRKPGLRAGYGRELETRLDRLEETIQDQGRQLAAHLGRQCAIVDDGGMAASHLGTPSRHGSMATAASLAPTSLFNPGLNQVSGGPMDPASRPLPQPITSNQPFPYSSLQTETSMDRRSIPEGGSSLYTPSVQSLTSPGPNSYQLQQGADGNHMLPPYDLLYALADLYFKHVNAWLPLLNRKTTLDTLFGPTPLEESDRILLHAIVATSLRFSRDPRLTPESRRQYHESSKQRVQLYGLENSTVRALQALTILALDVTGSTNGPPGWNLLAVIVRSLVQLGLAVESTVSVAAPMYPSIATLRASVLPESKSWIEDEERRRLFWSVYLLDRYATIATAFEFALDEKEIDRRLPCRDDLFAANKPVGTRWYHPTEHTRYSTGMSETLGSFSYYCELLSILTRIHQFLKRPVDIGSLADVEQWQSSYRALDTELNAWHFNLPDDFSNVLRLMSSNSTARSTTVGWVGLHAAYTLTVIRLNSSAAYPSSSSPIFTSSYSAMQRCLTAVDHLRRLCRFVLDNGMLDKLGPPFTFALWVASRVHLVHGSTMDHEVDPDIGLFVSTLWEMGQRWEVARRYSEILDRVLQEYRQSQHTVDVQGERVTPSSVKILADMRRTAYDLDLLLSRQPSMVLKSQHPTRGNTPAPNELEYLDVFDLFNFPRIPLAQENGASTGTQEIPPAVLHDQYAMSNNALNFMNFAVPNPDTDWLFNTA